MRPRVSAVIVRDSRILLIRRVNERGEYFILPGGGVEEETLEEGLVREVREETGLEPLQVEYLGVFTDTKFDHRVHHVFQVKVSDGEPNLGEPEASKYCEANQYHLEWHDISELQDLRLYPIGIVALLFPQESR